MDRLKKFLLGLAALAALALGGSALARATSSGNNDTAAQERTEQGDENEAADKEDGAEEAKDDGGTLSADLKARLKEAALARTGGGTVGEMERDGEKGATYEVEVKKTDGSQVDVRLDDKFNVVAVDADGGAEQQGEHEGDN